MLEGRTGGMIEGSYEGALLPCECASPNRNSGDIHDQSKPKDRKREIAMASLRAVTIFKLQRTIQLPYLPETS
jgi:hypothetical protein